MRRSILLLLLVLLVWFIIGFFLFKKYLCGLGSTAEETTTSYIAPVQKDTKNLSALGAWSVADGSNFTSNAKNHLEFMRSSSKHLVPIGAEAEDQLQKTADYLQRNNDRSLNITGYYKSDETNDSRLLPNLGLARAQDVKDILTGYGVGGNQITTDAKLLAFNWFSNDTLNKGVDFTFRKFEAADDKIAAIKNRLLGKPITLYFATGQNDIALSAQQRTDFADLLFYLDNVSDSKLVVSGHTDNVGNRDYNVNLSLERAKFVSDYLARNGGISSNKMAVSGEGPDRSIADNNTEEGKAKNRRVEVTLQ
jgi:outer membrane protein OmpA-like peptidoglycan-associated protein